MKKALAVLLGLAMVLPMAACTPATDVTDTTPSDTDATTTSAAETSETQATTEATPEKKYERYAKMTPEEIVAELTLEQKVSQMVQPILYNITEKPMKENCYGSIYGDEGAQDVTLWKATVDKFQRAALESEAGIPLVIAQDDAHGVGYCINAVYFPHNIGQGAAGDEELCYQIGLATADETKMCHMLWNLYPCVAQSTDPRWGRTYESYGSDLEEITKLSTAYTKGLIDGGVIACSKHYFGDGNTKYGTGENSDHERLIDRGEATLTDDEINELLKVYQAQIDAGVQTIMVSYSTLNGKKMHEQEEYIKKLKSEMGFKGFIVSDSMAIQNTSPATYEEQVISAINCGIDMLMEGQRYSDAKKILVDAVNSGKVTEERINEACTAIIKVKKDAGIFDDPLCENIKTTQKEPGSAEYRALAEKAVEKSLVLLKNDKNILPLKSGTKVYITGPAADDARAQCGGWTLGWNASYMDKMEGVTTIKGAFETYAKDYGIELITDPEQAKDADVVLLCVGEQAYAEWNGDTEDLALCGMCGLDGNKEAIAEAAKLGKPTVTCIIAGRNVIMDKKDMKNWDSIVMCYLPGSEGKGISDVLCGCSDFTGKLPSPWYASVDQILTDKDLFDRGYGLTYGEGFKPSDGPDADPNSSNNSQTDDPAADIPDPMEGTGYTQGVFNEDTYINEYAGVKIQAPDKISSISSMNFEGLRSSYIRGSSSERDKALFSAMTFDGGFKVDTASVWVWFNNPKISMPDKENATENDYLDLFKEYFQDLAPTQDVKLTYKDRTTVTLGGKEYVREVIDADTSPAEGTEMYDYLYVRKLDDGVMCIIFIEGYTNETTTPEFFEAMVK